MKDPVYSINEYESVKGLENWCRIDATYGKVPLSSQLKGAAKVFKKQRPFAANIMLQVANDLDAVN